MSPRPRKPRRCGRNLVGRAYKPRGVPLSNLPVVRLLPDEIEALRLCDLAGLTQSQAGERMGVSRGTIQRTVKQARRKLVGALVDGAVLLLPEAGEEQ